MVDMVAYPEASRSDYEEDGFRWYTASLRGMVLKDILEMKLEPCQSGLFASVECAK